MAVGYISHSALPRGAPRQGALCQGIALWRGGQPGSLDVTTLASYFPDMRHHCRDSDDVPLASRFAAVTALP